MSEELPRAVCEGEATGPDEVSLETGVTTLVSTVRDRLVDTDKRRRSSAGAARVRMVTTRQELTELARRDTTSISSNEIPDQWDRTGLSLQVPRLSRTDNSQTNYGFYDYQQAFLGAIAEAETKTDLSFPTDDLSRRALGYAGAELEAERRVETTRAEPAATATEETPPAAEATDEADPERLVEIRERYGFDEDATAREMRSWIQLTLDRGTESYIAARSGEADRTVRQDLRDDRAELSRLIETEDEPDTGTATDTGTTGADGDGDRPAPEDGVLGYDWVSTEDRAWSGRPLRGLLYATLTGEDGLGLSDDAVDRVELLNYGEPTVRGEAVPTEHDRLRLYADEELRYDPGAVDQFALDFRVVGDTAGTADEKQVTDALEQHLNAVQLMARYDPDRHGGGPPERETDGAGPAGTTDATAEYVDEERLETPHDDVPAGLLATMESTRVAWKEGEYEFDAYSTDGEIVGTSRSWELSR